MPEISLVEKTLNFLAEICQFQRSFRLHDYTPKLYIIYIFQYLSPAGALPGYMHGIGYPVLAGHHPYQVQYPPHHHPVSIPSRVPPNHTNQTQNNAKLSKASKDVAR